LRQSFDNLVSVAKCSLGSGIFANVDFKRGDLIFIWKGILMRGLYHWRVGKRWLQTDQYAWIDPYKDNPGCYINHSCNPNSGIRNSIEMVAMREIKKGEEVTFDYSTSESEDGWYLICHCGEKNCRRLIKPYEFLSKELKLNYRDFVSEYLKGI
jgi:hypothetical protein